MPSLTTPDRCCVIRSSYVCPLRSISTAHQHRRHHDCVQSIYSDGLYRMEILDRLSVCLGKGHVAAHVSSRAARLHPADHIAFCQVLVFKADGRMRIDSALFQHPQRLPGEP